MSSIELPANAARQTRTNGLHNKPLRKAPVRSQKPKDNSRPEKISSKQNDEASQLKNLYKSQLSTLLEVFPNWTESDLIYALKDADGDLEITIGRISDGISTQWDEVKSRKDKKIDAKKSAKTSTRPNSVVVKSSAPRNSAHNQRKSFIHPNLPDHAPSQNSSTPHKSTDNTNSTSNKAPKRAPIPPQKHQAPAPSSAATPPAAAKDPFTPTSNLVPSSGGVSWAKIAQRAVVVQQPPEPTANIDIPPPASSTSTTSPADDVNTTNDQIADAAETSSTPAEIKDDLEILDSNDSSTQDAQPSSSEIHQSPDSNNESDKPTDSSNQDSDVSNNKSISSRVIDQAEAVIMPPSSHNVDQLGLQFGSLSTEAPEDPQKSAPLATVADAAVDTTFTSNASQEKPLSTSEQPAFSSSASTQQEGKQSNSTTGPASSFASLQQSQNQYLPGLLAMPQGPLPNDFGAAMLYGFDPQRAQMMGYYNESFSQNNNSNAAAASSAPATKEDSTTAPSTGLPSSTANATNIMPNISTPNQSVGNFPHQFQQPGSYQGLNNMPYYSPFYYNMGVMQPNTQYPNPSLASNYSQHYMKQGMFPMYANNIPAMNLQQAQIQQLSMLHQHLQMSQQQQQLQNNQPNHPQQSKQNKQTSISTNAPSQHSNLPSQRGLGVGQYGPYGITNQSAQGNMNTFDQEQQSAQPQQYGGFPNSQLPGYLNPSPKGSNISGPGVVPSSIPKDMSSSNPKSVSTGLTSSQAAAAAVIGGTTFYQNPHQSGYSSQNSGSYPISSNQIQSPHQLYSNYGHNQQQSFPQSQQSQQQQQPQSLGQSQQQVVPQAVSQPQSQSLAYSQGNTSSMYNQQQQQQQQQQFQHSHSLHSSGNQQAPVQSQPGSYHASYNQLRNNPPYWSGQN
ncbi:CUE domain-containing protein [Smittium culicis]|uniref:RNA polymerase II degradation factor 1 n=1 Tax=Smittium culicis TaxID=133412 RepID=A0A1R1XHC1_9FUNG|nr:CUE domain-containing protein [Smittium culicis]OMJ14405.1 CUE domain-containing protein [Smittium culicis]